MQDAYRLSRRTDSGRAPATSSAAGWDAHAEGRAIRLAARTPAVWKIATQSFPGAHFATFPEKLVEPCILAGTSEKGVCAMRRAVGAGG